jgi:glutathione S-transferase
MKLYYAPGACSLVPHIVLRETGLPFALENAKGQVPVLELDDGARLTEGPVIAQFIADKAGSAALMPAGGSLARYRVMEWQNYITSELHKSFSPLFNPEFDTTAKALHSKLLRTKYEWVNSKLANDHFLTGDGFTAADAYLFTVTNWAKYVGLDLSNLQHLQAFLARVAARPAVQAAMKAEGLPG